MCMCSARGGNALCSTFEMIVATIACHYFNSCHSQCLFNSQPLVSSSESSITNEEEEPGDDQKQMSMKCQLSAQHRWPSAFSQDQG